MILELLSTSVPPGIAMVAHPGNFTVPEPATGIATVPLGLMVVFIGASTVTPFGRATVPPSGRVVEPSGFLAGCLALDGTVAFVPPPVSMAPVAGFGVAVA
jgi:hypothetical protein